MTETNDVIKIEVPRDHIDFDIGSEHFVLSLSDKSRARINEEYRKVASAELANTQRSAALQAELQTKLSNIKTNLSDADAKKREIAISNEYDFKFQKVAERAEEIANTMYLPFADVLFGEGSGQKIYDLCGQDIVAVNKVLGIVMTELNRETDVTDYMQQYAESVAKLKAEAEAGDANEPDGE